jgi:hypothetical protein
MSSLTRFTRFIIGDGDDSHGDTGLGQELGSYNKRRTKPDFHSFGKTFLSRYERTKMSRAMHLREPLSGLPVFQGYWTDFSGDDKNRERRQLYC